MKTSNKIILALISLPLVLMIFVYGNLYAKYKNNDFITEKQLEEERTIRTNLQTFHTINLTDFQGDHTVTITKGDAYTVSIDKSGQEAFSFVEDNGTLKIKSRNDFHSRVTITCPDFQNLVADSSVLVYLTEINLRRLDCKMEAGGFLTLNGAVDTLNLSVAQVTSVELQNESKIEILNLQMKDETKLEQSGGEVAAFGNVSIGDSCSIKFNGKTLQKLLQKTAQP